jgi:hypothetical protein
MRKKPILCVDFDGVVHSYVSPWINEFTIPDPPVPGALKWLWAATEWFNVVIYSSRSKTDAGRMAMKLWMMEHSKTDFDADHPMVGQGLVDAYPIDFAAEKPAAFLTIDDRAVTFEGDWSEFDPAAMLDFKPWNKRPAAPTRLEPYAD